jgi:hypothetical protein
MSAGEYNLYIEQGADFYNLFTIQDSAGNRVDLTGHTFTGKIRRTASATSVDAEFDFTILDQTQAATKGQVEVELAAADSSAIVLDSSADAVRTTTFFSYDIESVVGGIVTRWVQGTAEISPEVTKP